MTLQNTNPMNTWHKKKVAHGGDLHYQLLGDEIVALIFVELREVSGSLSDKRDHFDSSFLAKFKYKKYKSLLRADSVGN